MSTPSAHVVPLKTINGTSLVGYGDIQIDSTPSTGGGTVGPAGPEGPPGPIGPQGPKGDTGPAGPQGLKGDTGPAGADGTSVALKGSVASVGDLPAGAAQGDLYVVAASGDGYVWNGTAWANVGPIRGPKGDKGDQGDAGPIGPQGLKGDTGSNGPTGPTGPAGAQGPQGNDGPTGPQGPKGDTGSVGPQGPAGPGVAVGGTTGQMLVKTSGTDYETQWVNAPTGDVTKTGTETLTNKTLEAVSLTKGYTESVFEVTGATPALSPANGSIQTWVLTTNQAPTIGAWADGQSILLGVTAGSYTVTWPAVTWSKVGGSGTAPALTATGINWVVLWKVGGSIFGSFLGAA